MGKATLDTVPSIEVTGRMPRTTNTILEATGTYEIIRYMLYRHRVGLLATSTVVLAAYIIVDKIVLLFS